MTSFHGEGTSGLFYCGFEDCETVSSSSLGETLDSVTSYKCNTANCHCAGKSAKFCGHGRDDIFDLAELIGDVHGPVDFSCHSKQQHNDKVSYNCAFSGNSPPFFNS